MDSLSGFLNNRSLIIFVCIFSASISSFFALSIWLEDNSNRVSTALTLFFSAIGYWAKVRYELENKSKSVLDLERLIESNRVQIEELLVKSLEKLEVEMNIANTVQDKEFESIKDKMNQLAANLESHLSSVGHIETEKRLSNLAATTQVLQLNILQVSKEYENKRLLEELINDHEELRKFVKTLGFKEQSATDDDYSY